MVGVPISLSVASYFEGIIRWLYSLTPIDFVLLFWPLIVIDFPRSIVKSVFLLAHAYLAKTRRPEDTPVSFPKLSLIIPAHNEEKVIVRSIESSLAADYPNKEIIVVDDGSKDRTYQLAHPYANKGAIKLLHRDVASGSKATALNHGFLFATGEIVVVVDADTLIERNSLIELVKPLNDKNVGAVSGNVRILRGEDGGRNLLVRLQSYEYLISLELGRRFYSIIGTLLIISGAFGAFWRSSLQSLGEYDKDTITEDFDLTLKLRKTGKKLAFAEKAVSWTFAPETWRDWRRQRVRWTRGQIETLWKHRNILRRGRFDLRLVAAIYDMIFIDMVSLTMRFAWLFVVILLQYDRLVYIGIVMLFLYLVMESVTIVAATILSPRKEDLRNVLLIPVVVLFYRPYYALVRLKAYAEWITNRQSRW
jgi:biofilm PGA synthesis N-glycosyltransferase PgaC